jgi:FkbM family methyltransferase
MKWLEGIKLKYRANKYKNKNDKGGIAYILQSVKPGQTCLDIGAHKAGYLYFMLQQVGANGKIYAFEPQSHLFAYLSKMKQLMAWENVSLEHLALSDSQSTVTLYIPTNNVSEGSSPGATIVAQIDQSGFDATEQVQTETLDSYCQRMNIRPDFLKIDVEGNELKIFQGGLTTLKQCKPKIIVEIEERHVGKEQVQATFQLLQSLGYQAHFIHGMERKPLSEFSFEQYQNLNDKANYCNNFTFD